MHPCAWIPSANSSPSSDTAEMEGDRLCLNDIQCPEENICFKLWVAGLYNMTLGGI